MQTFAERLREAFIEEAYGKKFNGCFNEKIDTFETFAVFKNSPKGGDELYGLFKVTIKNEDDIEEWVDEVNASGGSAYFIRLSILVEEMDSEIINPKIAKKICKEVNKFYKRFGVIKSFEDFVPDSKGQTYMKFK
jgi:hypothetical protein